MFLPWKHASVRITGRWDRRSPEVITTTNTGGIIEAAFYGSTAVLHFDITTNEHPYPHLWIQVDNGAWVEAALAHYIRVTAAGDEDTLHQVKVIYKGAVEIQHRWYAPLIGKLTFKGIEVERPGVLFEDNRKVMEFVGDSITEGVLIDAEYQPYSFNQHNRVYQDDVCATYAWLTAEKLNLRPRIMGYGAVGATKSGQGSVPRAALAYPFVYDGCPLEEPEPEYILINHGANDRKKTAEEYVEGYAELLKVIRCKNPNSQIICVSAFCGVHPEALKNLVDRINQEFGDTIEFIDSTGWIPEEPLHPLRDGHKIVAENLAERLKPILRAVPKL